MFEYPHYSMANINKKIGCQKNSFFYVSGTVSLGLGFLLVSFDYSCDALSNRIRFLYFDLASLRI